MSYDNSYQGSGSPPNNQTISYEYAGGNNNNFYTSGSHVTINPTTNLLKIRSGNYGSSGTAKFLVTAQFPN